MNVIGPEYIYNKVPVGNKVYVRVMEERALKQNFKYQHLKVHSLNCFVLSDRNIEIVLMKVLKDRV